MRNRLILIFLLIPVILFAQEERFVVDRAHTRIQFSVEHFKINSVEGTFNSFEGLITKGADPLKLSVAMTIKAASLDTGDDSRDKHLRSADFLDVEKFPEITFRSHRVFRKKKQWMMEGDVLLHGITKRMTIPFMISEPFKDPLPNGSKRIIFSCEFEIDRRDFGITWSRVMDNGDLFVSNKVEIEIRGEARY